ncbi:RNA polymerase sigma factor [Actinosynnema sp. NPDC059335]|uniref:RNA polymerase sigma factor n=1 Tax=Actinosynnema sp. NPDC059335 TaxID=3346804 RepID=UPI003670D002
MSDDRESPGEEADAASGTPTRVDVPALYQRYHAVLHAYATRFLPSDRHADANDAMMTVFKRLVDMKAEGRLQEQPNWEAYLKLAVKNACLDILRTDRDHEELDPEDPWIHREAPADPTGDTVVDAVSRQEELRLANAAFEVLDATDVRLRPIVIGKLIEERTNRDIGAQLDLTGQRVGQLYEKALTLLQEEVNRTHDQ